MILECFPNSQHHVNVKMILWSRCHPSQGVRRPGFQEPGFPPAFPFGSLFGAVANLLPRFPWILIPEGKKPFYGNSFSGSLNPGQLEKGSSNCLSFF